MAESTGPDTGRAARTDKFAAALAAGHTIESAGRTVGLSPATSYRWAANPDVVDAVKNYRSDVRRQVADSLATGCTLAVSVLIEIARGGDSENARVKAALGILSATREWIDLEQLAQQVADIEQSLEQRDSTMGSARDRARLELVVDAPSDG